MKKKFLVVLAVLAMASNVSAATLITLYDGSQWVCEDVVLSSVIESIPSAVKVEHIDEELSGTIEETARQIKEYLDK